MGAMVLWVPWCCGCSYGSVLVPQWHCQAGIAATSCCMQIEDGAARWGCTMGLHACSSSPSFMFSTYPVEVIDPSVMLELHCSTGFCSMLPLAPDTPSGQPCRLQAVHPWPAVLLACCYLRLSQAVAHLLGLELILLCTMSS